MIFMKSIIRQTGSITGIIISLLLMLIFIPPHGKAQSNISGIIVGKKNEPIAKASVVLLMARDSSLVKGTFSAEDGLFSFEDISDGEYLISASFVGLQQVYSSPFSIKDRDKNLGKIILIEARTEMNAVTIVGKKSMYEQKPDRLVINVQNSVASTGSSALDVLEHSPGVVIDRQKNSISLKGKEGVTLMINGKINYMPADAVVELLQGMNSGNIEKIELITVPTSRLDAEGNAGYINIILKNTNQFGTNGSFSATWGYGEGWVSAADLNFNHRREKINIYGNFSYSRVNKPLPVFLNSKVSNQGIILETHFLGGRTETTELLNARIGIDYQAGKKNVLGVLVTGYQRRYTQTENNEVFMLKNNQPDTNVKQSNSELNNWRDITVNLNLQHDFDKDRRLSVNLDYMYFHNNQPVFYHRAYFKSPGNFVYDETQMSSKITPIRFWIGALDYSQKMGSHFYLETGVKRTDADFLNDLGLKKFEQGSWLTDSSQTAKYRLNENYSAIYASLNMTMDNNNKGKIGLRYEYTNSNLTTGDNENLVDKHYGNLFPVISFSHKLNEIASFNLSYNIRITRPTFNDLAPYIYYLNETTVITGNPALQPALTNTLQADYSFKKYTLSLSFSRENHSIASFQPTVDSLANKVDLTPENLDNQKLVSVLITVPLEVSNWWSMQYNLSGIWQQVIVGGNNPLKNAQLNINFNATESFRFAKNITAEISGFYQSPRLEGVYTQKGYGSLDIGIKKKLAGKNGSLIFSVSNILNSQDYVLTTNHPERNLVTDLRIGFVQRTFKLTYSRSFGNNKISEKRERSTGAEEEKGRVR